MQSVVRFLQEKLVVFRGFAINLEKWVRVYGRHIVTNRKNSIPSKEDFARAKAVMAAMHRGMDEVCKAVLDTYHNEKLLCEFKIGGNLKNEFRAIIFYCKQEHIEVAEKAGLTERIKETVFAELERVGRGKRDSITVEFVVDSEEQVMSVHGSYFNRLR